MTVQPRQTALLGSFHERLATLLAGLEEPNPTDPKPAATRATVKYLRILEACGPEEMIEAMSANVMASIAALKLLAPTYADATKLFMIMATNVAEKFIKAERTKPSQSERNPHR